jgi:hypothetical protein
MTRDRAADDLKRLYDRVAEEPIPDDMKALLKRLK